MPTNRGSSRHTPADNIIREHRRAVLACDLPEHGLKAGDVGVVVDVHAGGAGYTLEFMTLDGETIDVVTLRAQQVRPVRRRELPSARALT